MGIVYEALGKGCLCKDRDGHYYDVIEELGHGQPRFSGGWTKPDKKKPYCHWEHVSDLPWRADLKQATKEFLDYVNKRGFDGGVGYPIYINSDCDWFCPMLNKEGLYVVCMAKNETLPLIPEWKPVKRMPKRRTFWRAYHDLENLASKAGLMKRYWNPFEWNPEHFEKPKKDPDTEELSLF